MMLSEEQKNKYKGFNKQELKFLLLTCSGKDDIESFRYIVETKNILGMKDVIKNNFLKACQKNSLKIVKYLMGKCLSENKEFSDTLLREMDFSARHAGFCHAIDVVKYIYEYQFDVHFKNYGGLNIKNTIQLTIDGGNINIVEYLLHHEKFKDKINNTSFLLSGACASGNLNMMKYFLESTELNNLIMDKDNNLKNAYLNNQDEILNYLIFEHRIQPEEDTKRFIEQNEPLLKLFKLRDLNDKLNSELTVNVTNKKNLKL